MYGSKHLVANVLIYVCSWFVQLCDLLVDMWESLHHLPLCWVHPAPENYPSLAVDMEWHCPE